jgi:hypothetical protein
MSEGTRVVMWWETFQPLVCSQLSQAEQPLGGSVGKEVRNVKSVIQSHDRLCGLVVRVLGYRSGGPSSIPGTTRKKSSWSGTGCTQPREYN